MINLYVLFRKNDVYYNCLIVNELRNIDYFKVFSYDGFLQSIMFDKF